MNMAVSLPQIMGGANSFSGQVQDNGKAFPGSIGIRKCVQKRSTSDFSSWLFIAWDCSQTETSYWVRINLLPCSTIYDNSLSFCSSSIVYKKQQTTTTNNKPLSFIRWIKWTEFFLHVLGTRPEKHMAQMIPAFTYLYLYFTHSFFTTVREI